MEKSSRDSLFTAGRGWPFSEGGSWGTVDHLLVRLCTCVSLRFKFRMRIEGKTAVNEINAEITFIGIFRMNLNM